MTMVQVNQWVLVASLSVAFYFAIRQLVLVTAPASRLAHLLAIPSSSPAYPEVDLTPHDDVTKTLSIVRHAYNFTLDEQGRLYGLVAGDMGYAATSIVLDRSELRALDLSDVRRFIDRICDEDLRSIAESKDVGSCRQRITNALAKVASEIPRTELAIDCELDAIIEDLRWSAIGGRKYKRTALGRAGVNAMIDRLCKLRSKRALHEHSDDQAIDRFAAAMKAKLKRAREVKGRSGWDDPLACSDNALARELANHLFKTNPGNFEDIANLTMMLHQRGADPQLLADALKSELRAI